jgi:hypothetical protein
MRSTPARILKASLVLFGLCGGLAVRCSAQTPAMNSAAKSVVVELFTSEGCSDCPPAEAMALKMEQQVVPGADVIVLEEHVDYWNHDGWTDPFSSVAWTDRQQDYVSKLANGNPYTPEMVVDGESQFNGSDGSKAEAAIQNALRAPQTEVSITEATPDPGNSGDFKISVGKLEGDANGDVADVWLAVTEDGLHSAVGAGENAGHTLYHAAVLRSLRRIGVAKAGSDAAFNGDARVKLDSKWDRKDVSVVVFVQDKKTLKILGAASLKLTS